MNAFNKIEEKVKNPQTAFLALGGNDRALIDSALTQLRKTLLPAEAAELNHHRLVAKEDALDDMIATLKTMPFLAPKRLLEIHSAEKLVANDASLLIEYMENPSPTSLLLLVFDKVDKRNKLVTALFNKNAFFLCDIEGQAERLNFILSEAASLKIKISKESARFLSLALDDDLLAVRSALEKLSLSFKDREIHIDDIEQHIVSHKDQDVFLLARLISEGKLSESLFQLAMLRNNRENALKFLGVLLWQFRVLVHIRHCFDQGMSDFLVAKEVSVYKDRFVWMAHIAKKRKIAFHIQRLTRLLECDALLKSLSIKEPFNLIEKVVYQSSVGL